MQALSLAELNNLVRQALELTMPDTFWVRADIAELRVAVNGHCYLELVEHDDKTGQITAKARANCWRNTFAFLRPRFERESGRRLQAGISVLVEVQVSFHPQYGYALVITDIDPTYSLGDAARRRQAILKQLAEDGVIDMNHELTLPCPIRRVAVISSETAAGYGDFCNQLEQSGLPFVLRLFPATMQGEQVESSIISALNDVADELDNWDAVVIIRGGGAVTDLNGYESYALAANVAQFPLPIITGIGHERDETVIDLVAHTRLKTPTAVAAFLIEQWQGEIETLIRLEQRLHLAVQKQLAGERLLLAQTDKALSASAVHYIEHSHRQLTDYNSRLSSTIYRRLSTAHQQVARLEQRLSLTSLQHLQQQQHTLALIEKSLQLADPQHILRQGYSITRINGKAVRDASQAKPGDVLTTTLSRGSLQSTVNA